MPNQTEIAAAVEASRGQLGFAINPGIHVVDVFAEFDPASASTWSAAAGSVDPASGISVLCYDGLGQHVAPGEIVAEAAFGRLHLQVRLPVFEHAAHVVCIEQFRSVLLDEAAAYGTVRVAGLDRGFAAPSLTVEPWVALPCEGPPRDGGDRRNARRIVRSLDRTSMAPDDVSRWLARLPAGGGGVADAFRERATDLLLRSVVSELYTEDGVSRCVLASTPPRKLTVGPDVSPEADEFDALVVVCDWIYMQGTDTEVRHALLVNELGREWPGAVEFKVGVWTRLEPALDAAKLVYRAHLQAGSKDTLRSLGDLRKALGDEIQKLMQQTRDLSAALWRDVAVALGVTALRFGVDPAKATVAGPVYAAVFAACALYLVISLWLTTRTNRKFLNVVHETRAAWRTKLYGYLDASDYDKLAEIPLKSAEAVYGQAVRWSWGVVVAVASLLLALAAAEAELVSWASLAARALVRLRF